MKQIVTYLTVLLCFIHYSGFGNSEQTKYPSYNTNPLPPDSTGMTHNAVELAAKMHIGWNIGNTLEASGGETAWGNPMVTQELIDAVKRGGFNAIRIPCAWNQYLSNESNAEISDAWL